MSAPAVPGKITASVVVVTLKRPDFVRTCLQHLERQTVAPLEVVVVDASPDDRSYRVVSAEFPLVRYLRNPFGAGTTGLSRNIGLSEATGDVVAFVDDDAFAYADWLECLLQPYADPQVGGVGGRALSDQPGEASKATDQIGKLRPDGTLTGNFDADPGTLVEVDHFLGANMSFRREVLVSLGGIRDGYPGTCLREETDLAQRVKRAGWKLVYTPQATVIHVAAPYPKGQRFDVRYTYFAQRNHIVLLTRIRGIHSPELRGYLRVAGRAWAREAGRGLKAPAQLSDRGPKAVARTMAGSVARSSAIGVGVLVGLEAGVRQAAADRRAETI